MTEARSNDISQIQIDWLLDQLLQLQKALPKNSLLEKDIGNIIARFHVEILDENSAGAVLALSPEKKFIRMVEDLVDIWKKEKIEYDEKRSHVSKRDHDLLLFILANILKKIYALAQSF
jgi:hypothetical protein